MNDYINKLYTKYDERNWGSLLKETDVHMNSKYKCDGEEQFWAGWTCVLTYYSLVWNTPEHNVIQQ